jgi:hypothetical protein
VIIDLQGKGCCPRCGSTNQKVSVVEGCAWTCKCPACATEIEVFVTVEVCYRVNGSEGGYYSMSFMEGSPSNIAKLPDTSRQCS